jgi:hypothetical protein
MEKHYLIGVKLAQHTNRTTKNTTKEIYSFRISNLLALLTTFGAS